MDKLIQFREFLYDSYRTFLAVEIDDLESIRLSYCPTRVGKTELEPHYECVGYGSDHSGYLVQIGCFLDLTKNAIFCVSHITEDKRVCDSDKRFMDIEELGQPFYASIVEVSWNEPLEIIEHQCLEFTKKQLADLQKQIRIYLDK
ncbi:hypothetical protein [Synechococcus sp. PCC 6312]|uniref:hypothetical protein n=1 Tax=Synechococcus sp. (strain ATCC 27167 / PCC 6312) TaxID=195253 RepID=UPI00029F06C3|nr:hypothetical protein [Synechococcus sp. PCC 6312]AFY60080.1 hypothetical protein Syn6312_0872 [Synechococcus sp. PCC 6312]